MRSHSLKYLLITISFAISLISSLRASAKDVFIDSKLSTQEYLATTYGKESKYYIDVLLNNSTEICDTTYHEYYKPFALDLITSMSAIKKMYRPTSSEYRSVILNLHYYLIFGKILDSAYDDYKAKVMQELLKLKQIIDASGENKYEFLGILATAYYYCGKTDKAIKTEEQRLTLLTQKDKKYAYTLSNLITYTLNSKEQSRAESYLAELLSLEGINSEVKESILSSVVKDFNSSVPINVWSHILNDDFFAKHGTIAIVPLVSLIQKGDIAFLNTLNNQYLLKIDNENAIKCFRAIGSFLWDAGYTGESLTYCLQSVKLAERIDKQEYLLFNVDGRTNNEWNVIWSHYTDMGEGIKALTAAQKAILLAEKYFGKESKEWIENARILAADMSNVQSNYDPSIQLELEIISIAKRLYGEWSTEVAEYSMSLLGTYKQAHKSQEAIDFGNSLLKSPLTSIIDKGAVFNIMAQAYDDIGLHGLAMEVYNQAIINASDSASAQIFSINRAQKASDVSTIIEAYKALPGNASNAKRHYLLSSIARAYAEIGDLKQSGQYYEKAEKYLDIRAGTSSAVTFYLNRSADAASRYLRMKYLKNAEEIIENYQLSDSILIGKTFVAIANAYSDAYDYSTAFDYYEKVIPCYSRLEPTNESVITLLNNIATNASELGNMEFAIRAQKLVCELREDVNGYGHPLFNLALSNLIHDYIDVDSIQQAEEVYAKFEKSINFSTNERDKEFQLAYHKGLIDFKKKAYREAATSISCALQLTDVPTIKSNLLKQLETIAKEDGRLDDFATLRRQRLRLQRENIIDEFSELTSKERGNMVFLIDQFNNENMSALLDAPKLTTDAFNFFLFSKGLQFHTEQEIEKILKKKGLKAESYKSYIELKKQLTKALSGGDSISIKYISEQLPYLERELTNEFVEIEQLRRNLDITSKQVLSKLGINAIGIDFIRYENDSVPTYGAFVISSEIKEPIFLRLFTETELLELANLPNNQFYRDKNTRDRTRNLIWGKLEPYFASYTDLYFSPDGMLHTLGIEFLLDNNANPINQQYRLHRVFHLVDISKNEILGKNLVAVGVSDYNSPISDENVADRGSFNDLPGVRTEFSTLRQAISTAHNPIDTTMYYNDLAREVNFKMLSTRGVSGLHIATHGFFRDKKSLERSAEIEEDVDHNVALRTLRAGQESLAGLVLRGGNLSWQSINMDETEDDILTSHEIETLDFPNLRLTVLSACETGLGDINSDGVWGLQRSFRIAGTRNLICSLRRVDDKATARFMEIFYNHALNDKSIYDAFSCAQQTIYNENKRRPDIWASFILIE